MTHRISICLVALVVCFAATVVAVDKPGALELPDVPDEAFAEDAYDDDEPRTAKRLVVNADTVAPGDTVEAGVIFEMDPGWHIYWYDSGEGGMSTQIEFDARNATVGEVMWPQPGLYHEAGGAIITFGYNDTVLLFTELEVDDDADGDIELDAHVDYLVCEVDCIPGQADLTRTIPVDEETTSPQDDVHRWFDAARDLVPRSPQKTGVDVDVRYSHAPIESPDDFRVEITAIGCHDADDPDCLQLGDIHDEPADAFVYENIDTIDFDVVRLSEHPDAESGWFIELDGRATRDTPDGDDQLDGVLRLHDTDGTPIPTTVGELLPRTDSEQAQALVLGDDVGDVGAQPADTDPSTPTDPSLSLWYVLLLAFLGGAILNLMPCVFPVLAIKVFAFVNLAHEHRHSVYAHSATYTAGIVASMLVLAAAVIGLQVVGTQVGWGFQFQEPGFIAAVGAVLVIFAMNLFGLFEVTLNPGRLQQVADAPASHRRSFGEGVLAVVLATPCSAPFLGTAVGFALASPPWVIALTFTVLGIGLAAPFVILTLIPGAERFLPKPGPWMAHFKQLLGFALLATAIWLLWLIGQMAGTQGVIRLLIFLLSCAVAAWIFGLVQFKTAAIRRVGLTFALVIVVVSATLTLQFDDHTPSAETSDDAASQLHWKDWSEETVDSKLDDHRPVFVNFTADWCITCKVNEANVLEQPEVVEAVEEHDVAMIMADWTRRDDHIRSRLADFGKGGVPMYLVYSPNDPDNPELLPEVLSRSMVISHIEDAAP